MKLIISGQIITASVHERPPANASIKFRIGADRKQWTVSSGVVRKRAVTKPLIEAKVEEWFKKNWKPVVQAVPGEWETEIAKFVAEELRYVVQEHREGVEGILKDMAARLSEKALGGVTREDFRELVITPMEGEVAAKTWANKLSHMKRFWGWLAERERIDKDPSLGAKMPPKSAFGTHEEPWEEEWYQPVWEELGKDRWRGAHWQRVFEDLWWTGMDVKDLWQFQPKKHLVSLGAAYKIYKRRSKETEIIDQPISATLPAPVLSRWVQAFSASGPEDYLHPEGHNYSDAKSWGVQLLRAVYKAQAALGIPKTDVKSIRHTFATRWAKRYVLSQGKEGVPMDLLRMWMGHAHGSRVLEKVYAKWRSFAPARPAEAA